MQNLLIKTHGDGGNGADIGRIKTNDVGSDPELGSTTAPGTGGKYTLPNP